MTSVEVLLCTMSFECVIIDFVYLFWEEGVIIVPILEMMRLKLCTQPDKGMVSASEPPVGTR